MNDFYLYNNQIHINLTRLAHKIIKSDSIIFSALSNRAPSISTFINRIILNYDNDFELNKDLIKMKDPESYLKHRLSDEALDLINELGTKEDFDFTQNYKAPQYIKCLLETYARCLFIDREKLALKELVIEPINNALARNKALQIEYKDEKLKLTPITIAPSREGTFQYLIGTQDDKLLSIRLSRIKSVKLVGKANRIDETTRHEINENIAEFGPTFVQEKATTIKVRLTQKGIESYKYSVIHRPTHTSIENDDIYVFHCSENQALFFFFRFAGDAEILEPQSLRNKFHDLYKAGSGNYLTKQ